MSQFRGTENLVTKKKGGAAIVAAAAAAKAMWSDCRPKTRHRRVALVLSVAGALPNQATPTWRRGRTIDLAREMLGLVCKVFASPLFGAKAYTCGSFTRASKKRRTGIELTAHINKKLSLSVDNPDKAVAGKRRV